MRKDFGAVSIVSTGTIEEVVALLRGNIDISVRGPDLETLLHWAAAFNQNPEVIEYLVLAGFDPNAIDIDKCTPLHYAGGFNKNSEVIGHLSAMGGDPMKRDKQGWTPIDYCKKYNYIGKSVIIKQEKTI